MGYIRIFSIDLSSVDEYSYSILTIFYIHVYSSDDDSYWGLRLSAILFLSWIVTVLLILCVFVAPIGVGNFIFSVLRVPASLRHEPVSFVLGFLLILKATKAIVAAISYNQRFPVNQWLSRAVLLTSCKTAFLLLYFIPQIIGISLKAAVIGFFEITDVTNYFMEPFSLFKDWCTGLACVFSFFLLLHYGIFESADAAMGIKYTFVIKYQRCDNTTISYFTKCYFTITIPCHSLLYWN